MSPKKLATKPSKSKPSTDHSNKLMQVAEAQRWAVLDILARIDTDQTLDPNLFQNLATLADNARIIEAVASFLSAEASEASS